MVPTGEAPLQSTLIVTEEFLAELLDDLAERRFSKGFATLDTLVPLFPHLDPGLVNTQRLVGRVWLWVHAGYPNVDAAKLLLGKFPLDTKWLPAATQVCVRLAFGIRELIDGNATAAARKFQILLDSENLDNPIICAMINFLLCQCWQRDGHYDLAMSYAKSADHMALEHGRVRMHAVISTTLAWLRFQEGEREEPRKLLADAKTVLSETDDWISFAKIESCFGRIARRAGQHESACGFFEDSIQFCLKRPEQKRYLARAKANLAFEQRLLALSNSRELDDVTSRMRNENNIERQFVDIFSECSNLVSSLSKYNAMLPNLWKQEPVRKFSRDAIAALALKRAEELSRTARAEGLKRINAIRCRAIQNADDAENIYTAIGDRRGLGSLQLTRGYLELDANRVLEATASANRAYNLSVPDDPIGMARARLLQCVIEHDRADVEATDKILENTILLQALQLVTEAADLIRGTQHIRLKGKSLLWLGLSHARLGNFELARDFRNQAEICLKSSARDYLQSDLARLRLSFIDSSTAASALDDLIKDLYGPKTPRKLLHQRFDKIIVRVVWQQEQNLGRVAARLNMASHKVTKILREIGISVQKNSAIKPITN